MMRDIVGFGGDLGHNHHVARLVGGLQRSNRGRQLIAQNQNEARGHHGTALPAQSKNWPVSFVDSPSMTPSRFSAAACGETAP